MEGFTKLSNDEVRRKIKSRVARVAELEMEIALLREIMGRRIASMANKGAIEPKPEVKQHPKTVNKDAKPEASHSHAFKELD